MIGRTEECAALREALASARNGLASALVLRGDAGIGKTALLEYAIDQAEDCRVLRVTGIESEMELGFAALHQLVQPLLPGLGDLPEPQRAALESAFGLAGGPVPDRFLIGLATLTLLSAAADRTPDGTALLIAVDDAQWLDQASAGSLAFMARRLDADRIAIVLTVREDAGSQDHFDGLGSLRVRPLSVPEASELIATLADGPVAPGVADQLAERAAGSPLALVEAVRELSGEQLAGAALLPDPLPLGDDAQDRYWRKVATLPPDQRGFLLLASADPSGDPELLERAAAQLGLDPRLPQASEAGNLVTVADRVTFRHPLIRSAVYTGSPLRARQRVHAALAEASDPDRDADRIAWHRAAAAKVPDEGIAVLLENAAARARRRGGFTAAATFLRRAAELSPQDERRGERLLAAAEAEFTAGRVSQATALLDQADPDLADPRRWARSLRLRGSIHAKIGDGRRAPSTLLRAARALGPFDPEASLETMFDAMLATFYSSNDQEWIGTFATLSAAYPGNGTARVAVLDLVLKAYSALLTEGDAAAGPVLHQAVRAVIDSDLPDGHSIGSYEGALWCACELFEFAAGRVLSERLVAMCRARGMLGALPLALDHLGTWLAFAGRLSEAEAANVEGREILAATGTPDRLGIRSTELLLPAWRGQEAALREAAEGMTRECAASGQQRGTVYPHFAFTILGIGRRDYASALEHVRVLLGDNGPFLGIVAVPYAVEAAVGCEDFQTAELALSRLTARAGVSGTDWALGLLAQCRALAIRSAGPDSDAERERLFTESIRHLQRAGTISDLARTRLLFGEWLRRKKRRRPAREQLLAAQETFEAMGADAFAQRARLEAAATAAGGVSVPVARQARESTRAAEVKLTEREIQIARLVVEGATNAEVATQLFISANTVDYHLRHVYRKLGVPSRTMLSASFRDRLTGSERL